MLYQIRRKANSYLINRYTGPTILLIVCQQILVGLSLYFLTELGKDFAGGSKVSVTIALLFVATLILVYIPGYMSAFLIELGRCASYRDYAAQYFKALESNIGVTYDRSLRDEKEIWLISEAEKSISEILYYYFGLVSLILNALIPIFVIGLTIDYKFVLAYLCCFLIALALMRIPKNLLKRVHEEKIVSLSQLKSHLSKAWLNLSINNRLNAVSWKDKYDQNMQGWAQKTYVCEGSQMVATYALVLLSLFPVLFMIIIFLISDISPEIKAAILVTLPRQVQIIQTFQSIIAQLNERPSILAKLLLLQRSIPSADVSRVTDRIEYNKLRVNGDKLPSLSPLEELINSGFGRYTITGENGAGKSSLLLVLKHRIEESFYLPASPDQLSFSQELEGSTGQRQLQAMMQALKSGCKVLLLDEWNANLDSATSQKLDLEIERISKTSVVIEVVH